jgi:dimethylhistidine N-methyltransferase
MNLSRHSELPLRSIAPVESRELLDEVLSGLTSTPKTLPAKLFYDDEGARLFERICTLEEYYLTRSELTILRDRVGEIAALAGPRCALVEYGSGAGTKIRLLLDALHAPAAYVPIDISHLQLARVAADLASDYPSVAICPLCADYTRPLALPGLPAHDRRLAFFPGSTIGNFHPAEAAAFLTRIRRTVGPGGMLVLGVDRRKDPSLLHAAYDDPGGVTAAFNLNMLRRINRELGADFDTRKFQHLAFFNDQASRIEMHLVSTEDQVVQIGGSSVEVARSETIWTESSYKYDEDQLANVVGSAGFAVERLWTDRDGHFWVSVLVAE